MKKTLFTLSLLLCVFVGWTQIVTTNPSFVTNTYNGEIEVIYDATQGTAGLKDFTGDVYAHTGVITNQSASDSDWKHAPAWLDNVAKYKLTSLGNNKWKLLITPSMSAYYGLTSGEVVEKLAFVFRNSTGSIEGKDTGGKDIFVPVYENTLNVLFSAPTSNQTVPENGVVNFTITASEAANLTLYINGTNVKTAASATTLSHSYTFSTVNDYTVVAEAQNAGAAVYDTLYVCVPKDVETASRPSGIKDGINYINNSTVTLVMYAPEKNRVNVIGDFSNWANKNEFQMKKDGDYWWYTLSDLTSGKLYKYQYLVDDTLRISDAYTELVLDPWNDGWISSATYPDLPAYPSKTDGLVATFQTNKPAYNWEVTDFEMHPQENLVIYELLLRDFTNEKNLNAAIANLDYLKKLGVTAIELMPIQEFDGNNSWGYNPNHFFAPDKAYGTPDMYKKFIDECHKRGIAVIVDVVFNHATGNNPFAKLYWNNATNKTAANNPWFNVDAPHPHSVFHDFNHEFSGTREYFKRVLQYWITEYKIDGYRLDLTKGFTQKVSVEPVSSQYDQTRIDILTDYYNATKEVKEDVMFILEHFCDYSEEAVLANTGMYLWRNVNNAFSQAAMGYQSDSDFGGMISTPRQWVGFAESHDEERNFYKAKTWGTGDITTDSVARLKRVPLNIAFATLLPGPKMIWQFGEMGYDYSIEYNERTGEKPSALNWWNLNLRRNAYYESAAVIGLRKQFPTAFTEGTFQTNVSSNDWSNGRRIGLTHSDLNMVTLGNFRTDASISANPGFPKTGTWYELISGEELNVTNTDMTISMQPGELRIYTDRKVDKPNGVDASFTDEAAYIYPALTSGKVYITTNGNVNSVRVYNLQGVVINTLQNVNEIDLSALSTGVYLIELNTTNGRSIHKVIRK